MKEKQLYYDRTQGFLWYEDEDGPKFFKWIENATEQEYESAIIKQAPEDE